MNIRTDLALEQNEVREHENDGIIVDELNIGNVKITRIEVVTENGAAELGKPIGNYITVEVPPLSGQSYFDEDTVSVIKNEIISLLPKKGTVLVCGIGNTSVTPDALGPNAAKGVVATRHIGNELAEIAGLSELRAVAVLAPGVLGQTGMETGEILQGITEKIKPSAVIVIDALASRKLARLGCTVQISNTGIIPGSGVGNARNEISEATLSTKVISVGVPTVVDAYTLASDITGKDADKNTQNMMVTPREIDLLVQHAGKLISHSINCALQPSMSSEDLLALAF